jgi:AmiR/NasT family two-component response regulator
MTQQGLSEEMAYNVLRQKAMSQNMRLSEVAASLLALADLLTPSDKH